MQLVSSAIAFLVAVARFVLQLEEHLFFRFRQRTPIIRSGRRAVNGFDMVTTFVLPGFLASHRLFRPFIGVHTVSRTHVSGAPRSVETLNKNINFYFTEDSIYVVNTSYPGLH